MLLFLGLVIGTTFGALVMAFLNYATADDDK